MVLTVTSSVVVSAKIRYKYRPKNELIQILLIGSDNTFFNGCIFKIWYIYTGSLQRNFCERSQSHTVLLMRKGTFSMVLRDSAKHGSMRAGVLNSKFLSEVFKEDPTPERSPGLIPYVEVIRVDGLKNCSRYIGNHQDS